MLRSPSQCFVLHNEPKCIKFAKFQITLYSWFTDVRDISSVAVWDRDHDGIVCLKFDGECLYAKNRSESYYTNREPGSTIEGWLRSILQKYLRTYSVWMEVWSLDQLVPTELASYSSSLLIVRLYPSKIHSAKFLLCYCVAVYSPSAHGNRILQLDSLQTVLAPEPSVASASNKNAPIQLLTTYTQLMDSLGIL